MSFQFSPETLLNETNIQIEEAQALLITQQNLASIFEQRVRELGNVDPFTRTEVTRKASRARQTVTDTNQTIENLQVRVRALTTEIQVRAIEPPITQPIDGQPVLIPVTPPVLEQTKVFGLSLKQIAVLIGIGILIL